MNDPYFKLKPREPTPADECCSNVFVERLWKSLKYEAVYLHAYETVSAARGGISKYFAFYNAQRPHTALDRKPPDHVYFKAFPALPLAAAA